MSREPINHPAFPVNAYAGDSSNPPVRPNSGMAMLDYFARAALPALITTNKEESPEAIAELAYSLAYAMLEERQYTARK